MKSLDELDEKIFCEVLSDILIFSDNNGKKCKITFIYLKI
jgi:hypothetical protein